MSRDSWKGNHVRPQSLHGWNYVENDPINRVDPSGRCYGPIEFFRSIPGEKTLCENLDLAITIYTHPQATVQQKQQAAGYITLWWIGHSCGVAGVVFAGLGALIEAGVLAGEAHHGSQQNTPMPQEPQPLPGELPPQPIPTPELPEDEIPQYPDEYFPNRPIPPHQLPEVPPGAPPEYPNEHLGPAREECRALYFQYLGLLFAKDVAEAELREMEERGTPEWILENLRKAVRAHQDQLNKISRDYFMKGCPTIYGPLPDDTVPGDIPY